MFFIEYFVLINVMLFGHLRAVIPNLFKYKDFFYCKIFFQSKHIFMFLEFVGKLLKKFFKIMLSVEFILITSASSYTSQIIVQIYEWFTWFEDTWWTYK